MTRLTVVIGFLVAFIAGLMVGMERRPAPSTAWPASTQPSRPPRGWWAAELNLTSTQQEQMRQIWLEAARFGGREQEERRRQYRQARDNAIVALIRPEDAAKHEQILKDYAEQTAALDREWRNSYDQAVERTKSILTPEQREQYEMFLKRHPPGPTGRGEWDRGPRGDRDKGGRGREHGRPQDDDRATSRPESGRSE
ncbi:MAG: Spy/CpxP family protein refolding chaperone [Phycisphaerae bacterium]|nr:Spy/CpxP family protein refolding chaperone [Phycisphaerae bacterium]